VRISFDAKILIWASLDRADTGRFSLSLIEEMNWVPVISTIAVSEYLTGVEDTKHAESQKILEQQFEICPFDLAASGVAAQLFGPVKAIARQSGVSRVDMKAVLMIVATAKIRRARRFYSHDNNALKYARLAGMEAHQLNKRGNTLTTEFADPE